MLLRLQREPRWPVPAETALVCARSPPGLARLEVLGPFPTTLCSEDPADVLDPVVEGARPSVPAPLVGVVWIAKEVVIAVGLFIHLSGQPMIEVYLAQPQEQVGV